MSTSTAIIVAIGWAVLVALACGLSALMVIGRAFGNPSKGLPDLILVPGLKVGDGNLAIILLVSWLCWTIVGEIVVGVAWFLMRK